MNADPSVQLRLLDLQAADTALAQLEHRRRTLPELAAFADTQSRLDALDQDIIEIQTRLLDVVGDQERIEADVDSVRARAGRDEQRLLAGGLPGKELESLQHEITSLARRQSTLEDEVLEVMGQREELEAEQDKRSAARAQVAIELEKIAASRDQQCGEIDAAHQEKAAEREEIAKEIPVDLLGLYEKIRTGGGVGAAVLQHGRCQGCRMELASSELSAVRTADPTAVLRCENCRCILVRTAQSGL